jgi:hypothetical protein
VSCGCARVCDDHRNASVCQLVTSSS